MYIYAVIDLYTRMAYAKISPNLSEKGAAETILEAQEFMKFPFKMVQSDNGTLLTEQSSHAYRSILYIHKPSVGRWVEFKSINFFE